MDLRQLRYLVAVAEEGSLIAAAERLDLAQPALSRQVKSLEGELGHELFHRGPRGVALTAAGIAAIEVARRAIDMLAEAVLHARASGTGVSGKCTLAVGTRMITQGHAAGIARIVRENYPGIELGINELAFDDMWRAVESGEAHAGVGVPAPDERKLLQSEVLRHDVFDHAGIAVSHPLAARNKLSVADLEGETFLTWRNSLTGVGEAVDAELRKTGATIPRRIEFDDNYAVAAAVRAGRGWALIDKSSAWVLEPDARRIPIDDLKVLVPQALVSRRDRRDPVVTRVMEVVRSVLDGDHGGPRSRPAQPEDMLLAQIELRHLRYFDATIKAGSLGKAAADLGVTQPGLSRQIRDLERVVGAELLDRDSRGVQPTPAGNAFHEVAVRVLAEAESMIPEIERAARTASTPAICVIAGVPTLVVQRLLEELLQETQETGHTVLDLVDLPSARQAAALEAAQIDLGVCHVAGALLDDPTVRRMPLVDDALCCALLPANDRRASQTSVTLAELADLPFVAVPREFSPALYDAVQGEFTKLGFEPRIAGGYDGMRVMWSVVRQGQGWTLGLRSQLHEPPGGTAAVPLSDFSVPFGVHVLMRPDESRAAVLLLVESLLTIARRRG